MSVKQLVETAIADNTVTIFSKSWCSYCKRAKAVFASDFPDVKAHVIELDKRDDGSAIQDYLAEKTGQSTVPSVFVNKKHIGGSDAVIALKNQGKLASIVNA